MKSLSCYNKFLLSFRSNSFHEINSSPMLIDDSHQNIHFDFSFYLSSWKDTEICYLSKNYAKNDQNGQQSHRKCPCIFFSLFSSRTKNRDIFYIWNGCNFAGQSWHHPRIYAASLWEIINFVTEIVQGTISETEIPFILLLPLLTEQRVFLYPEVKVTSIAIL